MQFAVTGFRYYGCKNIKKSKPKVKLFLFVLTAILIVFLILMLSLINRNKINYLSQREIYYLCLCEASNNFQVSEKKNEVRNLNGAGYELSYDGDKCILAFGYFNKEEAEKVIGKVSQTFNDAKIIHQNFPAIKRKIREVINNNLSFKKNFKKLFDVETEIYNMCISFDRSLTSDKQVYKNIVKFSYLFEEILNDIKLTKVDKVYDLEIKNKLIININYIVEAFKNCKSEIYKGENISVYTKYLFLELCEAEISLRQELNKI